MLINAESSAYNKMYEEWRIVELALIRRLNSRVATNASHTDQTHSHSIANKNFLPSAAPQLIRTRNTGHRRAAGSDMIRG